MAANLLRNDVNFVLRRWFSAASEKSRGDMARTMKKKKMSDGAKNEGYGSEEEVQIFWMRDPKTGNWLPENRFNDVDAVDLRHRFLPKKI